jgi:hypothetical protein
MAFNDGRIYDESSDRWIKDLSSGGGAKNNGGRLTRLGLHFQERVCVTLL